MAHLNIHKRQTFIFNHIRNLGIPSNKQRVEFAKQFNCSPGAIYADCILYLKKPSIPTYPSAKLKVAIKERDNYTCQYCGIRKDKTVVDHVVPTILGGGNQKYNLVCACDSCNLKKRGGKVWIPLNFDALFGLNKQWARKILRLAEYDSRTKTFIE